jgi:hypothetical protein
VDAVGDLQTLRDKGFAVTENADGTASICWPNADPKTTFKVKVEGGRLYLATDRSATHKMLAKELGR